MGSLCLQHFMIHVWGFYILNVQLHSWLQACTQEPRSLSASHVREKQNNQKPQLLQTHQRSEVLEHAVIPKLEGQALQKMTGYLCRGFLVQG